MKMLRWILLPLAWVYGLVLRGRHWLYDSRTLKSSTPVVPTIAIGNLALGGTGKTPMLELILRILKDSHPTATLSRGYGRSGSDIHEVLATDDAARAGDEPLQVKRKLPHVRVFVGADRVKAIGTIQEQVPGVKVVVLDDALQHRRLKAGMNILLTTWQRPYYNDVLVPAGRLRDVTSRVKDVQIVVVTKSPALPAVEEQARWRQQLGLLPGQHLFFSGIQYDELRPVQGGDHIATLQNIILFTGIADPGPLVEYLNTRCKRLEHIAFPDHHSFSHKDLERLAACYSKFAPAQKLLVTTEKDAARLSPLAKGPLAGLPLAVIGMRAVILNDPERFGAFIKAHVGTH